MLSCSLRINRIAVGIDEKNSMVIDMYLRDKKNSVLHIFGVYEGEDPLTPGSLLQEVTEKIASEIYEKTRD